MSKFEIPLQVRYVRMQSSPELEAEIAAGAASLAPYRRKLTRCALVIGCWTQTAGRGRTYKVSLTLERQLGPTLTMRCESRLHADAHAALQLLQETFAHAASRLASLHRAPRLFLAATRLHPLQSQGSEPPSVRQEHR